MSSDTSLNSGIGERYLFFLGVQVTESMNERFMKNHIGQWYRTVKLTAMPPIVAALLTLLLAAKARADFTIEQMVLNTDQIPGGGGTFGFMEAPRINSHGAIAFSGPLFSEAIYTNADGPRVGSLRRAVGAGEIPPGIVVRFSAVGQPSLIDDGSIAFRGFGPDTNDTGIYVLLPDGNLKLVVDASIRRPGGPGTFTTFGSGIPVASKRWQRGFQSRHGLSNNCL